MSASHRVAAAGAASHPRLEGVLSELDRRGTTWSVLRGAEELDTSRIDVSVLIRDLERGSVGRILTSHGFLSAPGVPRASPRMFVTFSEPDGVWIRVRLVTRLGVSQPFKRLSVTRPRGLMVALLAPDGAGKSTAVERLSRDVPLPVRTVYMGLYGRDQPPPPDLVPGIGTVVRLLRQWRGYLLGRRHRRGGHIVLFDRYCYDARLPGRGDTSLRRVRSWMLGHACPPPDLTVVLDAPGEILYRRKPEHRAEELEERRQGYLLLAAAHGWVVLDAARDVDQVSRELTGLIWRAYRDRATGTRAAKSAPRGRPRRRGPRGG